MVNSLFSFSHGILKLVSEESRKCQGILRLKVHRPWQPGVRETYNFIIS